MKTIPKEASSARTVLGRLVRRRRQGETVRAPRVEGDATIPRVRIWRNQRREHEGKQIE